MKGTQTHDYIVVILTLELNVMKQKLKIKFSDKKIISQSCRHSWSYTNESITAITLFVKLVLAKLYSYSELDYPYQLTRIIID